MGGTGLAEETVRIDFQQAAILVDMARANGELVCEGLHHGHCWPRRCPSRSLVTAMDKPRTIAREGGGSVRPILTSGSDNGAVA